MMRREAKPASCGPCTRTGPLSLARVPAALGEPRRPALATVRGAERDEARLLAGTSRDIEVAWANPLSSKRAGLRTVSRSIPSFTYAIPSDRPGRVSPPWAQRG